MARLRDDYPEFTKRGAEVLAVGPDGLTAFLAYWRAQRLPYIGLPDPDHQVARRYGQTVNVLKLGRMPLVLIIDAGGTIRLAHYAASMSDIPENPVLLHALDDLRGPSGYAVLRG